MKTVQKGTEINRIADDLARDLVETKGWKYVGKTLWKREVRDAKKPMKSDE